MTAPFIPYEQTKHATDGEAWLWRGIGLFVLITVLLVFVTETHMSREIRYMVLVLYIPVNILNSIAAYLLFVSLWRSVWHGMQKFLIGCGALITTGFAVLSTLDFIGYARHVFLSDARLPYYLRGIAGGPGDGIAIVVWWVLLPLQVLAWLVLAVSLVLIRRYARRHARQFPDVTRDLHALFWFFILACCALALMFYVMEEVVWFAL